MTCGTCSGAIRPGAPFCPHCGAPVADGPAQADPLIGSVLARKFRLHQVLGEGGMGRVYRAEQLPLGVEVVIKTLHPQLTTDPMLVARFFREAQAASRLRHPNCVSILDFGDSDGTLYIAMEFLRGRSLARVLEQDGRFEPPRVYRIITQLLDVLTAAHQMEIVHRDLKPDNIMVEDLATHRDFVKVLDFGIAKIASAGSEKLTKTGMLFGTPSYMAPEQAAGGEVDGRTDLYSVGIIMFELLTGRVPFRADTLPMLLVDIATKPAPPLLSVRPDLPPALAALVDTTLAKDPAERPQTALDFKAALEQLERGTLQAAGAPTIRTDTQIACPRCGQPLAASAKFCAECGAQLTRAPSGLKDKLADLKRYLPTAVVDELAQLRARSAGEKREIVALVVDITGATSSDENDALADLYDELGELAIRHTGTLDRRAGAGTVIAFGLAIAHADEAERAIEAALDTRALVKRYAEQRRLALEVTCVIHGGSVVVESGTRGATFSPLGDTLDLPVRVAAAVPSNKIVITERIHRLVRTSVESRAMPSVRIKGQAAAVPLFEVTSASVATRAPLVALARPPFVGRADALRALTDAIEGATRGQALHITGEPGIGKSRLLEEVVRALVARHHAVIVAPARPDTNGTSPAVARIVEGLGGSVDALRALGLDLDDIRALAAYLPDAGGTPIADERAREAAIAMTVRTACELRARHAPLCLVVDDLHLADQLTVRTLTALIADPVERVTVLTAARPGHELPWRAGETTLVRTATLGRLADAEIAQIVAGALQPTRAPRELQEAVVARAGGSPLMALEVLHGMIDAGVLASIGERWTVVGDLASIARPAGLRALYASRIDALPGYARDVLSCVAAVGDESSRELLERVVAKEQGVPIERELRLLVARGWLAEADGRFRFAEPSAREAVYERLVQATRRELHRAIADALAAMPGSADDRIGEHYELGGEPARALDYLGRAVEAALRDRELRRAEKLLVRSRNLARSLATAQANRRLAEDSLRLAEVMLELGELAELRTVLAEGLAAAHKDDDAALVARIRRVRGRTAVAASQLDVALGDLDAALAAAVGLRDRMMIAELHGDLGEAYEKKGDLIKATDYLLRALELVQTAPGAVQPVVLRLLTALGRVVLRNREVDRAERFLRQALDLAEQLDDKAAAAKVLGNIAGVWHARTDYAKALECANRALALSREIGDLVGIARQLTNIGTLSSLSGDYAAAERSYDAAFAQAQRAGWREGMASAAAARERLSSAGMRAR